MDELPEGRVKPVTCKHRTLCLTHHEGQYGALDNKCPHQGGPLGEGSIEKGLLRCPWHGWDYDPLTGKSPGEFDDGVEAFPVEVRDDGVYVQFPEEETHVRTSSDVMVDPRRRARSPQAGRRPLCKRRGRPPAGPPPCRPLRCP